MKKSFKAVNLNLSYKPIIDIGIPELTVIEKSCNQQQMLLTAVPTNDTRPEHCPQCGNDSIVIQKKSTKQFRDLDIGIYHVGINVGNLRPFRP